MKSKVRVIVEKHTNNASQPFHKVFERQIDCDSAIMANSIPYSALDVSLRFMYGQDSVVHFVLDYF